MKDYLTRHHGQKEARPSEKTSRALSNLWMRRTWKRRNWKPSSADSGPQRGHRAQILRCATNVRWT